jgi:hypothetical protein
MAEGRCGFLAGLLIALVPVAAAQAAPAGDLLAPAQYRGGPRFGPTYRPRRRPRRRCWVERRRVRDRFGRVRVVMREVCR